MLNRRTLFAATLATGTMLALASGSALAQDSAACGKPDCTAFNRDRAAILAMAGTYRVTFNFHETAAFVPGYEPLEAKRSGGFEVVRVIEDTGRIIRLQHLLVVKDEEDKPYIVKHWRQDWTYEPETLLVYGGPDQWVVKPVETASRVDAWSQTVWQTDDSPRYGGVGRWAYDRGETRWVSDETARPLARRDAVRKPPYDHYIGINRHALTPAGWVHEQDNAKVGSRDSKPATFVHEVVLNSYRPSTDFDIAAADSYMAKTATYWAAVRKSWEEVMAAQGGIHLVQEAENGSATGKALMELADAVKDGKTASSDAVAQARALIANATAKGPAKAGASRG
ncbi:hypothetical protein GE253_15495 [Niveispirillum sp. SYP-B3756]|uniref:DUF6607 family protein n=1 Tax=Niveispirillum sp. SYP-B3756 TaxID=2662178 RepID=UPI0012923678|nr:DUF6607 family protein [Niveispirillum sp. SYP-B3756]MQP66739.1 hypothetical protein [Niveispirillum sp. SYP-B3756]